MLPPALPRAVLVRGLPHARAALSHGYPVTLLSAPAAGAEVGAPWWRALVTAARAAYPGVPMADLLDCGNAPGAAMAALRTGQLALVLGPCPARARVRAAAATLGGFVLDMPPRALDWASADSALRAGWLAGHLEEPPS